MNITELLKKGKTVEFELNDETHTVKLAPPTAEVAREIRNKFYAAGNVEKNKLKDDGGQGDLESVIAECVSACFENGSDESNVPIEEVREFVMRIGGATSDVVLYSMEVCGIKLGGKTEEATPDETTAF